MDVGAGNFDEQCIRLETTAMAAGAIEGCAVAAEEDANMQFVALPFEVLEEIMNPVEGFVALPEQSLLVFRQRCEWSRNINLVPFHRQQHLFLPPGGARFAPGLDGSLGERLGGVGDDELRIISQHIAESFTFGTGAKRMVERKENRLQLFEGASTALTEKSRA